MRSLWEAPLLVDDLPEAAVWQGIGSPAETYPNLNFDQRLGHLFEDAFAQLVIGCGHAEALARNLQVPGEGGRTLGEMDFLIRDRLLGAVVHLELAVKFYLAVPDGGGGMRFPGPDPRDDWSCKLERLRSKQLQLSKTPEACRLLRERFGVEEVVARQRVYGMIFDHIDACELSQPPCVSEKCRRGRWVYASECRAFWSERKQVRVLPKCLWPVADFGGLLEALPALPIEDVAVAAVDRCVLVWDVTDGGPFMIVPNGWPRACF